MWGRRRGVVARRGAARMPGSGGGGRTAAPAVRGRRGEDRAGVLVLGDRARPRDARPTRLRRRRVLLTDTRHAAETLQSSRGPGWVDWDRFIRQQVSELISKQDARLLRDVSPVFC